MTAAKALGDNLKFSLEAIKGPHSGETFEFEKNQITIGRDPTNDIMLASDPRVSRHHLSISQSGGQFFIVNSSQKNFVLLDGVNITSEKLESRSLIQVGETELKFTVLSSTDILAPVSEGSMGLPNFSAAPVMPPTPPQNGASRAKGAPVVGLPKISSSVPSPSRPSGMSPVSQPAGSGYGLGPASNPSISGYGGAQPSFGAPHASSQKIPDLSADANSKKKLFYLIIIILVVGMIYVMTSSKGERRNVEQKAFRTMEELDLVRKESEEITKNFQERRDKLTQPIYQRANENFLRGYRDYRQGQYLRAKESFQLVLNLDPGNELAKRYLNLAQIRFDELVKFHALQGRKFRERQNYRLCVAHMQTVMTLLGNDPSSKEYQEARQMHRECSVAQEARF